MNRTCYSNSVQISYQLTFQKTKSVCILSVDDIVIVMDQRTKEIGFVAGTADSTLRWERSPKSV
mgnify:CR=1 FL=1